MNFVIGLFLLVFVFVFALENVVEDVKEKVRVVVRIQHCNFFNLFRLVGIAVASVEKIRILRHPYSQGVLFRTQRSKFLPLRLISLRLFHFSHL